MASPHFLGQRRWTIRRVNVGILRAKPLEERQHRRVAGRGGDAGRGVPGGDHDDDRPFQRVSLLVATAPEASAFQGMVVDGDTGVMPSGLSHTRFVMISPSSTPPTTTASAKPTRTSPESLEVIHGLVVFSPQPGAPDDH